MLIEISKFANIRDNIENGNKKDASLQFHSLDNEEKRELISYLFACYRDDSFKVESFIRSLFVF